MSYESNIENCQICHKVAFEPRMCEKCYELEAARLKAEGSTSRAWVERRCTDCRGDCEVCREGFCEEHINAHGCKQKADPADVLCLEAGYLWNEYESIGEIYRINGHTYFTTHQRMRLHSEPPDVRIFQFKGVGERDIGDGCMVPNLDVEQVGKVDGVTGQTIWDTDEVEADHANA